MYGTAHQQEKMQLTERGKRRERKREDEPGTEVRSGLRCLRQSRKSNKARVGTTHHWAHTHTKECVCVFGLLYSEEILCEETHTHAGKPQTDGPVAMLFSPVLIAVCLSSRLPNMQIGQLALWWMGKKPPQSICEQTLSKLTSRLTDN